MQAHNRGTRTPAAANAEARIRIRFLRQELVGRRTMQQRLRTAFLAQLDPQVRGRAVEVRGRE